MSDSAEPTDLAPDGGLTYGTYLGLDAVLSATEPRTEAHDELLFIVQHQTSELWMQLVIHELHAARVLIEARDLEPSFKMLTRVARIFDQLNGAWDVLRTMTPSDYTQFRDRLGGSSGFQSAQYRMIEFVLGNRRPGLLRMHERTPELHGALSAELTRPSLYQAAITLLAERTGRDLDPGPFDAVRPVDPAVRAAWAEVYRDPATRWDLYELAEKLVDLEDHLRRWRFSHVTTVERIIGGKPGTGGTDGVPYLRRMLEIETFPELWHVRGDL